MRWRLLLLALVLSLAPIACQDTTSTPGFKFVMVKPGLIAEDVTVPVEPAPGSPVWPAVLCVVLNNVLFALAGYFVGATVSRSRILSQGGTLIADPSKE